jgi:hypothetical protein
MGKFKVGDRVSFGGVKGTVIETPSHINSEYPVFVKFPNSEAEAFTADGRWSPWHTKPLLKKLVKRKKKKAPVPKDLPNSIGARDIDAINFLLQCERERRAGK